MAQLEQIDVRATPNNLNREQVLQEIVDISRIPLPFLDLIGRTTHTNPFFEWPCDRLRAPAANAVIDGSLTEAATGSEEVAAAVRLGNHAQIAQQTTGTSTRFETLNNVGNESLARQVQKATQEVWRDVEYACLLNNANVVDTGTGGAAGETAGLEAWVDDEDVLTNTKAPQCYVDLSTGGITIGGWTNRGGLIIPAVDYSSVTDHEPLTFDSVKDVMDSLYQLGNNPTKLMARPSVIRLLSSFMFTSTAQIATLQRDKGEMGAAQAQSSVNSLISDYGAIVDFIPNRLQPASGDGTPVCDTLFIFDPEYLSLSVAGGGMRSKELPRNGLARAVQVHIDFGLCVKNPDALGAVFGIANDEAVIA